MAPRFTPDETRTFELSQDEARSGFALLVSRSDGVEVVPLSGTEIVIGRAEGADVVVPDASLSRQHACLRLGDDVTIEDLGSKNGTSLQGRKLAAGERATIGVGTVFELGTVTCVLERARGLTAKRAPPTPSDEAAPVVRDPTMKNLYALIDVFAPSPLAVLILGETGVGKEVYAEAVHRRSPRAKAPFMAINCAALPESMLEAELYGYEKGAFTGAAQAKAGLFEAAHGGTVFLDEVGEIPIATQAKLLRVLESGEVMRLGSIKAKTVDVRFVSATNRDLRGLIAEKRFRADLYFRLNGMTITLPPLRARKSDVLRLAEFFAARAATAMKKPAPSITPRAAARLEAHPWPGNVRELRNVIDRATLLSAGRPIDLEHLVLEEADAPTAPEASVDSNKPTLGGAGAREDEHALKGKLRDLEKQRVIDALAKTGGNQSHAAKLLGISRYTLMSRMEEFGMARPRKRTQD